MACPHSYLGLVRAYIDVGLNLDARGRDGTTILMWAAYWSSLEIVNLLVGAGADVNAYDPEGRTVLMYAIAGGRLPTVQAIATAGADLSQIDKSGKGVAEHAVIEGRNVRLPFGVQIAIHATNDRSAIATWLREFATGGR